MAALLRILTRIRIRILVLSPSIQHTNILVEPLDRNDCDLLGLYKRSEDTPSQVSRVKRAFATMSILRRLSSLRGRKRELLFLPRVLQHFPPACNLHVRFKPGIVDREKMTLISQCFQGFDHFIVLVHTDHCRWYYARTHALHQPDQLFVCSRAQYTGVPFDYMDGERAGVFTK